MIVAPEWYALETATVNAALALRREAEFGTVEVGKRADFMLLAADQTAYVLFFNAAFMGWPPFGVI